MNIMRYLTANILILLLVGSASNARQQINSKETPRKSLLGPDEDGKDEKALAPAAEPDYVVGPADVLDISVWKEPDFSRTVPVRPDGKISLPLLNDIQAAGLTPIQLSAFITEKLRKYVTQPQVTVVVTVINSQRVFVLGEVARPGPISMLPNMTVLQALAFAGGFTQFANQKGIYVLRSEGGKENRYWFNYKAAIRGGILKQNIVLKPGDTVVVP